jgi:hypothetical protein
VGALESLGNNLGLPMAAPRRGLTDQPSSGGTSQQTARSFRSVAEKATRNARAVRSCGTKYSIAT